MNFKTISLLMTSVLSLAISATTFAGPIVKIDLNAKSIDLGTIGNGTQSFDRTLRVTRSSYTPDKVEIKVAFDVSSSVCSNYETEEYWVEGGYEEVCYRDAAGEPTCREEYVSGHYDTREVCTGYEDVAAGRKRTFILDFKKAVELTGNQKEVFDVYFRQPDHYRTKLDFAGKVVKAGANYSIESRASLFVRRGLKFIAK